MEAYLKQHNLPNEWDYFDPAKADEKRECGLHAAWGGKAVAFRPAAEFDGLYLGVSGIVDQPMNSYHLDHLQYLETEAIHIMREVAAEFERPALLFSGGKDSICLLRLAEKAFRPSDIPMPLLNIDTGHHFPELNRVPRPPRRRARRQAHRPHGRGRHRQRHWPMPAPGEVSRNRLQIPTLLAAIEEFRFDCCIGGARRDEEKARAKERFFSFRDSFGQWDPKNQRPEIWNLYNARLNPGENMRVFPLSNWTEMDVWEYIQQGKARSAGHLLQPPRANVSAAAASGQSAAARSKPILAAAQDRTSRSRTSSSASAPSATSSAPA